MSPPRTDESDQGTTPPSPFSYFFPLLLVVSACGGFIFWRRARRRADGGIPINLSSNTATGIRLSEDGPPTLSFISNNASTDSLPTHALDDLPILLHHQHPARTSPSIRTASANERADGSSDFPVSRLPTSTTSSAPTSTAGRGILGRARRSTKRRQNGPVEGGEGESSESEGEGGKGDELFQIGDGEEDEPGLGPLGRS
ncbi:hypothetical protein IAR55_003263 [Kwoniella newhampshirensis]|uniref:Uncharacterized protein n=1 Tax=Kwoniella newhampshirensis TaxID=1651941 RepID=A0AAW0YM62_9TREE